MAAHSDYVEHLREFDPADLDWSIFKRRIDNYCIANEITDENRKGAILFNVLSEEAYKLVYNWCLPTEPTDENYSELIPLLTEHFKPSLTVFAVRYQFYNSPRTSSETVRDWSARLRNLVVLCEYEELDMVLRDHFIVGYNKGPVQDRLFQKKKSITFKKGSGNSSF
ncbi:hypothetical protein NQ314_001975 [Rhamnusium bicolor]|uniref:Uncharacterized protein n=1 Tax=Rhamnusium bicolor TaxID=1586634 RepID=A0AAV8ZSK2_9CUCU|nr:hypothetical protein NQ314_001975 [Rhamnusium bicolor]